MNFLGHCYLCGTKKELYTGNLGGDFYKGKMENYVHLPKHIYDGIKLHRFIDNYTDHSSHIKSVATIFKENGISKVSFIGCDILLDHFLSKNWNQFHTQTYSEFVEQVYIEIEQNLHFVSQEYLFVFNKMQEYMWFYHYPSIEGIGLILSQFSRRLHFSNNLSECLKVYLNNQKTIDKSFEEFLIDIKIASSKFIIDQNSGNS